MANIHLNWDWSCAWFQHNAFQCPMSVTLSESLGFHEPEPVGPFLPNALNFCTVFLRGQALLLFHRALKITAVREVDGRAVRPDTYRARAPAAAAWRSSVRLCWSLSPQPPPHGPFITSLFCDAGKQRGQNGKCPCIRRIVWREYNFLWAGECSLLNYLGPVYVCATLRGMAEDF